MINPIDLSKLDRNQKLQLLDLLAEKSKRARDKRDNYKPHKGQLEVHADLSEIRLVTSGNGSGKTAMAINEALWAAQGYNPITKAFTPVPARIIVVLDNPTKIDEVWLPEMRKWYNLKPEHCHKNGKAHYSELTFDNGSQILFMSHCQEELIFESIELDVAIFDEPPPRRIFVSLKRGGRKKGRKPRFLIIGTPIACSWLRKEIYEPWVKGDLKDTSCFKFGTKENEKNLSEGYIESFSRILSEKEKRIRLYGDFFDLDGLALSHIFNRTVHVIPAFEWDSSNPVVVAIDPHKAKPHHAMMLGVDREGYLYYIKEIKSKAVARDFARDLKKWYQGYRVIDITCDSLGAEEFSGGEGFSSFVQILNDEGVRTRVTSYLDKSDEDFIDRIQSVLVIPNIPNSFGQKIPKLRIFVGNFGIIGDIENVQWTRYKNYEEFKPKLDITNKDFLSCLKYALATNLSYNKTKAAIYRPLKTVETYGVVPSIKRLQFKRGSR